MPEYVSKLEYEFRVRSENRVRMETGFEFKVRIKTEHDFRVRIENIVRVPSTYLNIVRVHGAY